MSMPTRINPRTKALQNLFAAALHTVEDAVVAIDPRATIMSVNQQALDLLNSDVSVKRAIGADIRKLMSHAPSFASFITKKCLSRKRGISEHVFDIDGARGAGVVSVQGHISPDGCVLLFEDVTNAGETDKLKTEFVSMASHQLRTPLTAIRWYIEELYEGEIGALTQEQKEYLRQALESNIRMIKLVKNLLNISRLEDQRLTVNPEPTDMLRLIEDVVSEHRPLAKAKNCEIIFEKPGGRIPKIRLDPALMRQVVVNLVANAVKYSTGINKPSEVHVRLEKRPVEIIVSVQDSGVGVPKGLQHRVFQKFFRADNVFKMQAEGTGLGLYIAKLIVETSGGRIWFDSEENKGSTFSFSLPLKGSRYRKGERTLA